MILVPRTGAARTDKDGRIPDLIILNALRGMCMALADSVPGVSGGTIAFLLGFYDKFIASLDDLFHGRKAERIEALRFLIQLGIGWAAGMIAAILLLTQVFESHIYGISSLFIGFILFAIPLVIAEEKETLRGKWKWIVFLLIGIVFVVGISSFNPTSGGGAVQGIGGYAYVYLGGIVAISAMVLPGISGSTLLLIMGLYLPVITAVRAVIGFDVSALPTVIVFALGVVTGIVLFIRLLRFLMERFRVQMIFLIIGLMIGSIYSVILGPTTLAVPRAPLSMESFHWLAFLLGGVVILGLQALKGWMGKKLKG